MNVLEKSCKLLSNTNTCQSYLAGETTVSEKLSKTTTDEELSKTTMDVELSKTTMDVELSKTTMDEELSKTTMDEELSKTTMDVELSKTTMDEEQSKTTMDEEQSKTTVDEERRKTTNKTRIKITTKSLARTFVYNYTQNEINKNIKNIPLNSVRPFSNFTYPLEVDMVELVETYKKQGFVKNRIINPFPYTYITNPAQKCRVTKHSGRTDKVFILFIVKSSYKHLAQRDAIRRTWGDDKYMTYIRTIFVLGLPPGGTDTHVNTEWRVHRDILQMNFSDTYMNNTLKMMASVYWTTEFCEHAKYVIMIDDDFYVSLETLITLLQKLPPELQQMLYLGNIFTFRNPSREKGSKWYVSPSEYPFDLFPPFINAGTIVMSMDFVKDVRIAMPYTAFFRFDDIYMSIIAYKLGVAPLGSKRFCNCKILPGIKEYLFHYIATSHGYTPTEQVWAWNRHNKRPNMTLMIDI